MVTFMHAKCVQCIHFGLIKVVIINLGLGRLHTINVGKSHISCIVYNRLTHSLLPNKTYQNCPTERTAGKRLTASPKCWMKMKLVITVQSLRNPVRRRPARRKMMRKRTCPCVQSEGEGRIRPTSPWRISLSCSMLQVPGRPNLLYNKGRQKVRKRFGEAKKKFFLVARLL